MKRICVLVLCSGLLVVILYLGNIFFISNRYDTYEPLRLASARLDGDLFSFQLSGFSDILGLLIDINEQVSVELANRHVLDNQEELLSIQLFNEPKRVNVHFLQRDSRWENHMFGSFTVGRGGCGPTSLAMVASTLRGEEILPCYVNSWGQRFYVSGIGVAHAMFSSPDMLRHFGLRYEAISLHDDEAIINALQNGAMMMTSVQSSNSPSARPGNEGIFTTEPDGQGGHIIVITGVTDDGNILLMDSLRPDIHENTEGWPLEIVRREIHRFIDILWTYTKDYENDGNFSHCHQS